VQAEGKPENIRAAINKIEEAIAKFHAIEDNANETKASIRLGNIYKANREFRKAEQIFQH